MALDTIDKVRDAELNAEKAERAAADEADRIVAKAGDDASALKDTRIKEAHSKADSLVSDASRRGDALMADATLEAGKNVEALRSSVVSKEDAALKLILDDLTV